MANSLNITINLTNSSFNIENAGGLTGAISGDIVAPDGTTETYSAALASGSNLNVLFSSQAAFTNSSGNLQRGSWKFTYTDSAATPVTGNVVFDFNTTNFPTNLIETGASTVEDGIVTPSVTMSVDCFSGELTVTDNSVYEINTVVPSFNPVYKNEVYSPPNVSPLINTGAVYGVDIDITPIYKGTYTSYLTGKGTWLFEETNSLVTESNSLTADVTVISNIDGGNQITIDCLSASLCDIWECIRDLNSRYKNASCTNERVAKKEKAKLERVMQLMTLTESALACGESSLVDGYITEIKSITNCTSCS